MSVNQGETPNIAARLQGLAEPNALVVSADTYRLIEGFFECQDMGMHVLKGISQPMPVYQVLKVSTARSRLDALGQKGIIDLVGREHEAGLLFDFWHRAQEGVGQVVLLTGEAGIGKSRLVLALKAHVEQAGEVLVRECRCSAYHQNSAFHPIIDLLERVVFAFEPTDTAVEKLRKIEDLLAQDEFSFPEAVPLLASLLSVPLDGRYVPLSLTPERQKQQLMQMLVRVLVVQAAQQPILLVVEDLHWADPSTQELLGLVIDESPMTHICTLLTSRPDFNAPWGERSHINQITLNRLSRDQVVEMVVRVRSQALAMETSQDIPAVSAAVFRELNELKFSAANSLIGMPLCSRGRLYISHVLVGPNGLVGHYEKVHLAGPVYGEGKVFSPGKQFRVFDVDGITVEINICYDGRHPGSSLSVAHMGAEVVLHPHGNLIGGLGTDPVDWTGNKQVYLGRRSIDTCTYTVVNNSIGNLRDRGGQVRKFCGGAVVFGLDGEFVARSSSRQRRPHMIIADLDIEGLRRTRVRSAISQRQTEVYVKAMA